MTKENVKAAREYRARKRAEMLELKKRGITTVTIQVLVGAEKKIAQAFEQIFTPVEWKIVDGQKIQYDLIDTFMLSGASNMVRFDTPEADIGLKLIPDRYVPQFVALALRGDNEQISVVSAQFPLLARAMSIGHCGWDDASLLDVCRETGTSLESLRPTFREEHEALGESLMEWVCVGAVGLDRSEIVEFVSDFLDLLRDNLGTISRTSPGSLARSFAELRDHLVKAGVPHLHEIESLLSDPKSIAIPKGVAAEDTAVILFLPSAFGAGNNFLFCGFGNSRHEADGWRKNEYQHMHGIAKLPKSPSPWAQTVVHHLTKQGVIFLDENQAAEYMSGEGRYWQWKFRLSDESKSTALLWSLRKPPTPLSDLAKRNASALRLMENDVSAR